MKHIKQVSLFPAQSDGEISPLEELILLVLTANFMDYVNFAAVMNNLQKYYEKT